MITYIGILTVKPGQRSEYMKKLVATGVIDEFKKQEGNVFYTVSESITDPDQVIVADGWTNKDTFTAHDTSSIVDVKWRPLSNQYVVNIEHYILTEVTE